MKIRIKRFDTSLSLPQYETDGAVAFDFRVRVPQTILPRGHAYVPLNVAIEIPRGYTLIMAPRSSLHKRGLIPYNSIGVFDEDFCGDADEYKAILYNVTDEPVTIEKGARLMQGFLKQYERAEWEEVSEMNRANRGGIGSTGVN
ncbi:MAG: dUTP diphosphatase [Candidatus Doudnabacteria bacterium]|nr:dUTP diphosphatase [Candidatus Doudnabacteria bacterium]